MKSWMVNIEISVNSRLGIEMNSILIEFYFFMQKTAYEMRISNWSSDVCSSDLVVFLVLSVVVVLGPVIWDGLLWLLPLSDSDHWAFGVLRYGKIGRASCRERVCQYV